MIETPLPVSLQFDKEKQKFIIFFDASAYAVSSCHRNIFHLLIEGLTSARVSHKMEYGTAFHAALAHYYTHRRFAQTKDEVFQLQAESLQKAIAYYMRPEIEIPDDDWRTPAHLINCIGQYFNYYTVDPMEVISVTVINPETGLREVKPLIEQKFAVPFYSDDLVDVLLSGTIDMGGYYFNQLVITDHKSTADKRSRYYLKSYDTSTQLMLYSFIFQHLFPELCIENYGVGTMINGIFLRESGKNKFVRGDVQHFREPQMDGFYKHLTRTVQEIVAAFHMWIEDGTQFLQNFTQCNTKFGCPYKSLCLAAPCDVEDLKQQKFVRRIYDPREFQNTEVANGD